MVTPWTMALGISFEFVLQRCIHTCRAVNPVLRFLTQNVCTTGKLIVGEWRLIVSAIPAPVALMIQHIEGVPVEVLLRNRVLTLKHY